MILYHVTSMQTAAAILRHGFKDGTSRYMMDREHSGVWLSDSPLLANPGAVGSGTVLAVTFNRPIEDLADFEWKEDGKGYREWLVPAALANAADSVELVSL